MLDVLDHQHVGVEIERPAKRRIAVDIHLLNESVGALVPVRNDEIVELVENALFPVRNHRERKARIGHAH